MEALDPPVALRRTRRSSVGAKAETDTDRPLSAPKTPRRRKKVVRFSDPGLASGLTPMIRRTSIGTPKRRRSSTPLRSSGAGAIAPSSPSSRPNENATLLPLHQTADGRVERRIRRNGLRDMLNKIEQDKKRKAKTAQSEIAHLKAEVNSRDREIYELQNATVMIDTDRIWDLEQQVDDLKAELGRRTRAQKSSSLSYSCTMDVSDPSDDGFMDMAPDEEHFGNSTMAQLHASTPSKTRSSFLTPPATSPTIPASPCFRNLPQTPVSHHTGVQAHLPDPAKQQVEEELASLQLEVCKLTATLDSYRNLSTRVTDLLSSANPKSTAEASASPMEAVESQVQSLLQNMSDRTAALNLLTSAICDLGFPGNDASEMIVSLTSGFRAARLELEYLTPGEVTLPLSSHSAEVLDLLLTQLRALAKKVKEDEDSIDEYHELEQSLRKQLDARVSVMEGLNADIAKAQELMDERNNKIRELEIGNDRLKGAVDGYVRDISELEKLVQRMEQESRSSTETNIAQQKSKDELLASKDVSIAELEAKIVEAVEQTAELLKEMGDIETSITTQATAMNKQHGAALALRDARAAELRGEVDRVNSSLRAAHETIHVLRLENGGLQTQMQEEKQRAKTAMDSMKTELQRVLQMSQDFLDSPKAASRDKGSDGAAGSPTGSRTVVRSGGYLSSGLARRGSKKLRRRHDSGLGLLNEDAVDV